MKKRKLKLKLQEAESVAELYRKEKMDYYKDLIELVNNPDSKRSTEIRYNMKFINEFKVGFENLIMFGNYRTETL